VSEQHTMTPLPEKDGGGRTLDPAGELPKGVQGRLFSNDLEIPTSRL
jgi:hypothetical protein